MMKNKHDNVLTIDDLSAYLKIPKSTLYKLVREGQIPSQKIGRHWRFHRETLDEWLRSGNGKVFRTSEKISWSK